MALVATAVLSAATIPTTSATGTPPATIKVSSARATPVPAAGAAATSFSAVAISPPTTTDAAISTQALSHAVKPAPSTTATPSPATSSAVLISGSAPRTRPAATPGSTALTRRDGTIKGFFAAQHAPADSKQVTPTGSAYKLPKVEIAGLTPSQQVFSISTGLNPLSMVIAGGDEFFLFMNLRAEHQWASHSMTPRKWVQAAGIYNTELEKTKRRLGYYGWTVKKTPRALMDKLGEIEPMVLRRLSAGDYKCEL